MSVMSNGTQAIASQCSGNALEERVSPADVERALQQIPNVALLRNFDVAANLARGGDVDLLVRSVPEARAGLLARLGRPLWGAKRSYIYSLLYIDAHIDMFEHVEWRGARYVNTEDLWSHVACESSPSRIGLAHEATICWMATLLYGRRFKARYRDKIIEAAAAEPTLFRQALRFAAGRSLGERLYSLAAEGRPEDCVPIIDRVRRAAWLASFVRNPVSTVKGYLSYYLHELRLLLKPEAPWFVVLGPDGSGKSTAIKSAGAALARTFWGVQVLHFRPRVLPSRTVTTTPHEQVPYSIPRSCAKLAFFVLDWWIGLYKINRMRAKNCLVLMDRHYVDLQVDPKRYRSRAPDWLVRIAGWLVPKPNAWVILEASPETLQKRKGEISNSEAAHLHMLYRKVCASFNNVHFVDAERSPSQVQSDLSAIIVANTRDRCNALR